MSHALLVALSLVVSDATTRRSAVVQVVEKVSPAVVYVGTVQVVERRVARSLFDPFFFGPLEERRAVEGLGSGVIIDPTGIIVTNEHVIRGASEIHIVLADGRQLDADVIGADAENDLAVLKVNAKGPLPAARLGTSSDLMIGETTICIGSPLGLKKTVTVGVVSALGRSIRNESRTFNDFIQTDASINPGNSGGPLLNIDGEIIGINSAIIASAQNIGFAIPSDKVRRIVAELKHYGKVRPSWIGLDVAPLTLETSQRVGWDRTYGTLIANVENGSPAETAGLQAGDVIAMVGSTQIEDSDDFRSRLASFTLNSPMALKVYRGGQMLDVALTPIEFPAKLVDATVWERIGIRVKAAPGKGMQIVNVRPGSDAAQLNLQPGDLLRAINGQRIDSSEGFREAIVNARSRRSVLVVVQRGKIGAYFTFPI